MATSDADVAAKLIERLLVDPAFRARFRRNPAEACREAGLDELAQEMSIGAGKAMMTLDMRESKSSLAGVMMAAAMEGVGVMQFVQHVAPHLDDIPEAIGDVLSRVNLPAIGGAWRPAPSRRRRGRPDAAPPAPTASTGPSRVDTAAAGNGAAPAAAAARGRPPADAAAPEAAAAAAPEQAAAAKPKTAAEEAAEKIAKEESPEAKTAEEAQKAAADIAEDAKDLPERDRPARRHDRAEGRPSTSAARRRPRRRGGPAAAAPAAAAPPRPPRPLRAAPAPAARRRRRPRRPSGPARTARSPPPGVPPPATSGLGRGGGQGAAREQEPRPRRRRAEGHPLGRAWTRA